MIGTCILDTETNRTRLLRVSDTRSNRTRLLCVPKADSTWKSTGTCILDTRSNRTRFLNASEADSNVIPLETAYCIDGQIALGCSAYRIHGVIEIDGPVHPRQILLDSHWGLHIGHTG
eukprot:4899127-Pyramimonas_sp.AAC.1